MLKLSSRLQVSNTSILQHFVAVIENRSCTLQMTCHKGRDVCSKSLRMILQIQIQKYKYKVQLQIQWRIQMCHKGEDMCSKSLRMILHNWWHGSSMSQNIVCTNRIWRLQIGKFETFLQWIKHLLYKFYVKTLSTIYSNIYICFYDDFVLRISIIAVCTIQVVNSIYTIQHQHLKHKLLKL